MNFNYARHSSMPENLKRLPSYAAAMKWYDSRVPYTKGEYKGERPLGLDRKYKRTRISKDDTGAIHIWHYSTKIITYYSDGRLNLCSNSNHFHGESISTCTIMQELLVPTFIQRVNGKIYYVTNALNAETRCFHWIDGGLEIPALNEIPKKRNIETVPVLHWLANAEINNKYAPFMEYAKHMLNISKEFNSQVSFLSANTVQTRKKAVRWDMREQVRKREVMFQSLDTAIAQPTEEARLLAYYQLLQELTRVASKSWTTWARKSEWSCNYAELNKFLREVIKYHYPSTVFVAKEVTNGRPAPTTNNKYIHYGTGAKDRTT